MSSSAGESFSTTAEEIFFSYPDRTVAEWQHFIAQGLLDDGPLPEDLKAELRLLVLYLQRVTAAEGEVDADGDRAPASLRLGVRGRDGCAYELIGRLGTGGHSIVYQALQRMPFERPVAVKVYYASATDLKSIDGLRELNAIRRLHHPGVCQVLDAGITPWEQPFLVLELIEGDPLNRYVAERAVSYEERMELFGDVLNVVTYAHGQGVVHRDLKPQNILIHSASRRVKLIDFSISAIDDPSEKTSSCQTVAGYGTREYQSPEQAGLTSHTVDARSDVFSLGCVLYELLTGERALPQGIAAEGPRPWAAATGRRFEHSMRAEANCAPPSQRTPLAAIIERCLAIDPADRFQSAADLKAHLDAVLAGSPIPLPRRRQLPGRRWWPVVAATILVAGLTSAGVSLMRSLRPPRAQPVSVDPRRHEELLQRAEQMAHRLATNVISGDKQEIRMAAAALMGALDRECLLDTTPTGLVFLSRYAHLLAGTFGNEGKNEAETLLAPRVGDLGRLMAIDPAAASMIVLEVMFLDIERGAPDDAISLSAVLEEHGIMRIGGEPLGRWAIATSEALIRTDRLDEAFTTLANVLDLPVVMPTRWRMGLLVNQAGIREQQGRAEDAIAVLAPHLSTEQPKSIDEAHYSFAMHLSVGRCCLKLQRIAEAIPPLQVAASLVEPWRNAVPKDAAVIAWALLGEALEGVGDDAAAASACRIALANLTKLCSEGKIPKAMLGGLGRQLQERIDRLSGRVL